MEHEPDRERVAQQFRTFSESIARGESSFYGRLAQGVATDDDLLDLAASAPRRQPLPVLLFGIVHYLLLQGAEGRGLERHYPDLGPEPPAPGADPYPAFRSFCLEHRSEITHLFATRRVQTNEVRRSALLVPMFATVSSRDPRPLAIIEVGASAGLNLLWDRYGYDYGPAGRTGSRAAGLQLSCEVRSGAPPLPDPLPDVASRVGFDLQPIDVTDPDQATWLRALIWPDQRARRTRLEAALEIARSDPPRLIAGDGLTDAGAAIRSAPADVAPCVVHSFTLNQVPAAARAAFDEMLAGADPPHPAYRLAIEWLDDGPSPTLELTTYHEGRAFTELLGTGHHHGEWIEWGPRPLPR